MRSTKTTWRFDSRQAPIAVICVLMGLPFAYASWSYLRPHFADQPSRCTVLSKEFSGDSEGTVDVVTVAVRHVVGGVSYTGDADVLYNTSEGLSKFADGKQVPCLYLASSPDVIALQPTNWSYPLGFAGVALVSFALAVACFRVQPKQRPSPF